MKATNQVSGIFTADHYNQANCFSPVQFANRKLTLCIARAFRCIVPVCHPKGGCGEAAYTLGEYFNQIKVRGVEKSGVLWCNPASIRYRLRSSFICHTQFPETTHGTAICTYIDPQSTTAGRFSAVRTGSPRWRSCHGDRHSGPHTRTSSLSQVNLVDLT